MAPEMASKGIRLARIILLTWSPVTESNRRPSPYHGDALPTELTGPVFSCLAGVLAGTGALRGQSRPASKSLPYSGRPCVLVGRGRDLRVAAGAAAAGAGPRAARATRAGTGAARAAAARAGAA